MSCNRIILFILAGLIISLIGCEEVKPRTQRDLTSLDISQAEKNKRIDYYTDQIKETLPFTKVRWELVTTGEKIKRITYLGRSLYIETASRRLYAIDTATGLHQWIYTLDAPLDFSFCGVKNVPEKEFKLRKQIVQLKKEIVDEIKKRKADKKRIAELKRRLRDTGRLFTLTTPHDLIYFLSRGRLICLHRRRGNKIWEKTLAFVPATPPCATREAVYIGALDRNRMYQYDVVKKYEKNWFGIKGDLTTRPIYESPSLYFASGDGRLYSYNVIQGEQNWVYPTEKAIKADLLLDEDIIYVGSTDCAFYAINRYTGTLEWKFECGVPITTQAIINRREVTKGNKVTIERTVYFRADNDALYALRFINVPDRDVRGRKITIRQAELKWKLPDGKKFLFSGIKQISYIIGMDNNTLYAVNDETGEVKGKYSLKLFPFRIPDPEEAVLYLGTSDGYLFAVKEPKASF